MLRIFTTIAITISFLLLASPFAFAGDICEQPPVTLFGNATIQDDWLLYWEPDNPQEIAPGGAVGVSIYGKCPPYTWSVSGSGFALANSETSVLSNTLSANSSACGAATIIVTDGCGNTTEGSLRCTNGRWIRTSQKFCPAPGPPTTITSAGQHIRVDGKWKMIQNRFRYYSTGTSSCIYAYIPEDVCRGSSYCDTFLGLGECIEDQEIPYIAVDYCGDGKYKGVGCNCVSGFELQIWGCP